jgi:hypothetical protein
MGGTLSVGVGRAGRSLLRLTAIMSWSCVATLCHAQWRPAVQGYPLHTAVMLLITCQLRGLCCWQTAVLAPLPT